MGQQEGTGLSSAKLRRVLCAAFMGVVLGAVAGPVAVASSSVGSTTYQVNAQHSGYLDADTPAPPLDRRWTRRLGTRVSYPLIADGRVFVSVDDSALGTSMIYALDAATGQTLWSRTGGEPLARIAYDAGRVFSYDKTGSLRALDAATGRTEWIAGQTQRFGSSPPIAHDGVVYTVGDGDGTDGYARRESDGQLVWTAGGMPAGGVPAIGDGRIYVSGGCSGAEARDLATGRYVWHRSATPSCTQDDGPTTVFADGLLSVRAHYFAAPHGALLNAADGTELARSDADWAPAVKDSLRLVMAAGVLRAESTAGGPALWTFTGDGKLTGPALIVGDHAYVTSASGRVYALNLAFGYEEWSDDTGTPINPPSRTSGSARAAACSRCPPAERWSATRRVTSRAQPRPRERRPCSGPGCSQRRRERVPGQSRP